NGSLVTNATWATRFKSRMLNDDNYSGFRSAFCPLVSAEAVKLGKSATVATNFCHTVQWYSKGGSYQYGGSLPWNISWSNMSITRLPSKTGGNVTSFKAYVYGDFLDETQINSLAEQNAISSARSKAYLDAMRLLVDHALATW